MGLKNGDHTDQSSRRCHPITLICWISSAVIAFSSQKNRLQHHIPHLLSPEIQTPSYLRHLIEPHHPPRKLRLQNLDLLVIPRICKTTTDVRAFSYQAPVLWNHLPIWVQGPGGLTPSLYLKPDLSPSSLIAKIEGGGSGEGDDSPSLHFDYSSSLVLLLFRSLSVSSIHVRIPGRPLIPLLSQ